ncbi:MAG: hypothetical protein ACR2JN_12910, partial [Lapillicoccus sp.]
MLGFPTGPEAAAAGGVVQWFERGQILGEGVDGGVGDRRRGR